MKSEKNAVVIAITIIGLILLSITSPAKAQIGKGSGVSSCDILNIAVGSRAASLGGAFMAFSDDATATFWNAAGLTSLTAIEFKFGHAALYQDMSMEYFAAAVPISERFSSGIGVLYVNYGSFAKYSADDQPLGEFSGHNMVLSLSLAYKLTDRIALGITAKGISEKLDEYSALGYAFDFGARYDFGMCAFGFTAKNIGSGLRFEDERSPLPAKYAAGVGIRAFDNRLRFATDINFPRNGVLGLNHGIEYFYLNTIIIRAGYSYSLSQMDDSHANGMVCGIGFKILSGSIDYSYSPGGDGGGIHKIDFSLKLDH